jgi:hypothetical protein
MGEDEEGTHERFKPHCQQLVDPKIKEHRGRIVKNTGDGWGWGEPLHMGFDAAADRPGRRWSGSM